MSAQVRWYSLDRDSQVCEHEPVGLEKALEIALEYYARGGTFFESGEEWLAATMFGFMRSPHQFIELTAHGPAEIAYRFEYADPNASLLRRMFGGIFQFETVLRSKEELVERVTEFFENPPEAIKSRLQGGR